MNRQSHTIDKHGDFSNNCYLECTQILRCYGSPRGGIEFCWILVYVLKFHDRNAVLAISDAEYSCR